VKGRPLDKEGVDSCNDGTSHGTVTPQEFTPVYSLATHDRLASAAAVFAGRHGAVAGLARRRGSSRQALSRQAHAAARAVEGAQAARRLARLRPRLAEALRQLRQAVVLDHDRQAEFAATAQALGVSLSAAAALLAVLLRDRAPSVARLGRLSQTAGRRAGPVLAALDRRSGARARQVAADEIFAGRKPVLMTVEQDSLCWLGAQLADNREGPTWAEQLRRLPAAEQVTRDGGVGLRKGVALLNRERLQAGQAPLADQDDHFHLLQRARRALREVRHKAARLLRRAEQAQAAYDRAGRRGQKRRTLWSVRHWWQKAEQAFDRWAAQERAYGRLRAALALVTPQGELNTRGRAEAEVRAALAELTGPEWERVRRRLVVAETFTFLDRVQERLAAVPLPEAVKARVVRAEGLKRRPELLRGDGPQAAALRGVALAAGALVGLLGEAGQRAAAAVRGILRGAWRASSLVEGLNSVLRMHQGRQKRLTQGLLDLKRLYWNPHPFRAGKRKGHSPYSRLGLVLPPGGWWELLQRPPEQLEQELSALNPAA
jgi:hypothetical protein